jgi:hypothetical protein
LTTFIFFLQVFVEFIRKLPYNNGNVDGDVYITETLNISEVQKKVLYLVKPQGDDSRTNKSDYTTENPSNKYMRYQLLGAEGVGTAIAHTLRVASDIESMSFYRRGFDFCAQGYS